MHETDNMVVVSSYEILTLSDWLIIHKNRINFVSLTATNNPVFQVATKILSVTATESHKC